jgi:hypothetical protein
MKSVIRTNGHAIHDHDHDSANVYIRTVLPVTQGGHTPAHLITLCQLCYREVHQHGSCAGPALGGGCFDGLGGRDTLAIGTIQDYERDVCGDIPFEAEWEDERQQERFRRLHSYPMQVAWTQKRRAS